MKKTILIPFIVIASILSAKAQIQITVNPTKEIKEISPYIYGRNGGVSDNQWQLLKDAGVKLFRENQGNNCTKYNWRKKLTSHPDWYNNVYGNDWDAEAQLLQANMPEAKGMWAFQLLGYVAKTNQFNFNDWDYNHSQWWEGVSNNWCGGGGPGTGNGDPDKYLEPWPADSTVAILTHWFDELGLNKEQFQYWNMDNEPECWNGTHDDVMPQAISAEEYIQRYVAVAMKARALFPEIKIVGPSFTNEWQWYNWQTGTVPDPQNPNKKYPWAEYFIKRIAEEQQRTGVRLLDVLDFHSYLDNSRDATLQLHRVFYDTTYDYPGANGCKVINGGWDNSITKEYIFKRCNDWLDKYMSAGHGVTMGISEMGSLYSQDPNVVAVCYASLLGTFAENNVELFTPWDWYIGQWEALHLFTHYTGNIAVHSTSSQNNLVSAYSSLNTGKDMLSIVLVNRDVTNSQSVRILPENASLSVEKVSCFQLSELPSTETFVSAAQNALKESEVAVQNNSIALTLPKLSVTAIQIPLQSNSGISQPKETQYRLYPNPASRQVILETFGLSGTIITISDMTGKTVKSLHKANNGKTTIPIDISGLKKGLYIVNIRDNHANYSQKLLVE
ncbi:MAG: T9SS type A sorting domain-containing protein [Prevotella sp.]|jgi:hypothetical protein|nr:T9SS type A sorting domain-containing protein [Prevotella sp.]